MGRIVPVLQAICRQEIVWEVLFKPARRRDLVVAVVFAVFGAAMFVVLGIGAWWETRDLKLPLLAGLFVLLFALLGLLSWTQLRWPVTLRLSEVDKVAALYQVPDKTTIESAPSIPIPTQRKKSPFRTLKIVTGIALLVLLLSFVAIPAALAAIAVAGGGFLGQWIQQRKR